jgi:phage terminase large subunit GpA-like protein
MTQPATTIEPTLLPDRILRRATVARYLPPDLAERIPERVTVRLTAALRHRLRRPERIAVADHAEKYRRVTAVDAHPGPWRHEFAPHCVQIMNTFGLPWVREVWFCGVEQSGKTNTMLNCLGWTIDRDPGNAYYLMPTEDASGKLVGRKLIPMLQESKALAKYLSKRADDTTRGLIVFKHGVSLFPAHANSATSMATFSAKYGFGDEVDKYPAMVGKEASPIDLIRKRARQHRGRHKFFFASTPAGQFVQKGLESCHQIWEFACRCPDCSEYVRPDAEHLDLPEGATPESVERDPASIGLACPECGSIWTEVDRETAIRAGRWQARKGGELARPAKVGFHHRSWECLDVPLHEIAAAYLKSQTGDLAAKIAWANGYEAIDYQSEHKDREEDAILRLRDGRPAGVVPTEADALSIHIDTQDKGFWYEIRAWRYGLDLKSWLVKAGYVPSANAADFSSLDALLAAEYPDTNGEPHRIMAGIIDSAGHRTSEVYAWCRTSGVLPSRGAQGRKTQPVTISRIDKFPGSNKPIPGGLNLYHLDTHFHKDLLANKLQIDPTDNGAWVLHSGYTVDQLAALQQNPGSPQVHNLEEYARQMCAEYRDERNLWQCPNGKANHLWDCAQMGLALVMYLGWQHAVSEKNENMPSAPQRRVYSKGVARD